VTRSLASFVYVSDDEHESAWFGPGDDVPAWAAAKITTDRAWVGEAEVEREAAPKRAPGRPRTSDK
jgi:hypothetical protein